MLQNAVVIPEIRIYSPSDNGEQNTSGDEQALGSASENVGEEAFKKTDMFKPRIIDGVCYFDFEPSTTVPWQDYFNLRARNLFASSQYHRNNAYINYKTNAGCVTTTSGSIDLLREYVQPLLNHDIRQMMDRYLAIYFRPGLENVLSNNGDNVIVEQRLRGVCRQMLDSAKRLFIGRGDRPLTPNLDQDSGAASPLLGSDLPKRKQHKSRRVRNSPNRNCPSDSESDASQTHTLFVPKRKPSKAKSWSGGSGRSTPASRSSCRAGEAVRREGPRWDPARIAESTLFVMGAKANKALGLGAQRGRLYMKHQDIFRYCGDFEDKLWLYEQALMPSARGRAFLLLLEDIQNLAKTDEYKDAPGVEVDDLPSFKVPEFMINKMRSSMLSLRTDIPSEGGKKRKHKSPASDRSQASSLNPGSLFGDTKPSPYASPLTAEEEVLPDEEPVETEEILCSRADLSNEDEVHEELMLTEEPVEEQEIAFIVDI